ncbi:MAG: hypothetical protein WC030_00495 [Candidatus Paceibacterota bacterium]
MDGGHSDSGTLQLPSALFSWDSPQKDGGSDLLTPISQALAELKRRQADSDLKQRVLDYLDNDIPAYFAQGPILYLARHLATPNLETIRFSSLLRAFSVPVVIGQDPSDKFVSNNPLKRALCRLPVHTAKMNSDGSTAEEYQKVTIVDFNVANGKPFQEIETLWGEKLTRFHAGLCSRLFDSAVRLEDDSPWIDRHHRGDLLAHYREFLALFIVGGVLFEDFLSDDPEELEFMETVFRPAFSHVEKVFGVRPLITQLLPRSAQSELFWMAYPREVLDIINGIPGRAAEYV